MIECKPCAEAGHKGVPAHYQATPAGQSTTGKAQPAMCRDHYQGREPKKLTPNQARRVRRLEPIPGEGELDELVKEEAEPVPSLEDKRHTKLDTAQVLTIAKDSYIETYGPCSKKNISRTSWELWERIKALPLDSYLLLPVAEDEKTSNARSRYCQIMLRCKKTFKPDFDIQLRCNHVHRHIVVEKVPLKIK